MSQNDMPVFCDVTADEQIEALKSFCVPLGAKIISGNSQDVLADLVKNMGAFYAREISESDLEMVLNSLVSLIIIAPEEKCAKLASQFCENLLKASLPERYGVVKLRIFSNLFHGLISASKNRYTVFVFLAKCSLAARNLQYLQLDLELIKKYLKTWQSSIEETQALYRLLFDATSQMNDSQNALKFINELLSTYTKETACKSRDDAHKCIVYCINDPNIFIFDNLLLLEPIKFLEGELIHNLFTIFVSGNLSQYTDFADSHKQILSQFGTDHERNINKMRILSLMSLAESSKDLSFDLLQNELKITADEIESFVIDAIRTKYIRCKIDHLARNVTVMSVSYRTFTKQNWNALKERLEKWRENLAAVDQNLTNILAQPALLQMS